MAFRYGFCVTLQKRIYNLDFIFELAEDTEDIRHGVFGIEQSYCDGFSVYVKDRSESLLGFGKIAAFSAYKVTEIIKIILIPEF